MLSGAAIRHFGLTGGRALAAGFIAGGVDFGAGVAADHYLLGNGLGTALFSNVLGFGVGEFAGYAGKGIARGIANSGFGQAVGRAYQGIGMAGNVLRNSISTALHYTDDIMDRAYIGGRRIRGVATELERNMIYAPISSGLSRRHQRAITLAIRQTQVVTRANYIVISRDRAIGAAFWDRIPLLRRLQKPMGSKAKTKWFAGLRWMEKPRFQVRISDNDLLAVLADNGNGFEALGDARVYRPGRNDLIGNRINANLGSPVIQHGPHITGMRMRAHGATRARAEEIAYAFGQNGYIDPFGRPATGIELWEHFGGSRVWTNYPPN